MARYTKSETSPYGGRTLVTVTTDPRGRIVKWDAINSATGLSYHFQHDELLVQYFTNAAAAAIMTVAHEETAEPSTVCTTNHTLAHVGWLKRS